MKRQSGLFLLPIMCISSAVLNGAEQSQGPMNAQWFYDKNNPYKKANDLHQDRKWKDAAKEYGLILSVKRTDKYNCNMAKLNLAACLMAQGKPTEHWKSFDALLAIPKEKRLPKKIFSGSEQLLEKMVLVRTDKVGIGDIFHFLEAANVLKKRTFCHVILSVRDFLKGTLAGTAEAYGFGLVGEKEEPSKTDYVTHIIGLLGHLGLDPARTAPERVMLTALERAMVAVAQQIDPVLAQGKILAMVNVGENRSATLIGGRQLPCDPKAHGRHLDSEPFMMLLKNHANLVLMDCGTKEGRVTISEDQKDQYLQLEAEEQAFDTLIALALLMNSNKKIIGFGADNGPTNVFARALNKEAQRRMALVIPNGSKETGEYDMRMEGEGSVYTQMISNCPVYKCETPADQTAVIEKAYQDMTADK